MAKCKLSLAKVTTPIAKNESICTLFPVFILTLVSIQLPLNSSTSLETEAPLSLAKQNKHFYLKRYKTLVQRSFSGTVLTETSYS